MTFQKTADKKNILSPEVMEPDKEYSTTWNPCDSYQFFGKSDRIEKCTEMVEKLIFDFPNTHLNLHMEVSRNGRLHFHGTISFTSQDAINDFYIHRIHSLQQLFNIDIDNLIDKEKWTIYCTKSVKIMNVIINSEEVYKRITKQRRKRNIVDKNGIEHKPFF